MKATPTRSGDIITFPYDTFERCGRLLFGRGFNNNEWQQEALNRLFLVGGGIYPSENWPRSLSLLFRKAKTSQQQVAIAKARVEYWIATGR